MHPLSCPGDRVEPVLCDRMSCRTASVHLERRRTIGDVRDGLAA